MGHKKHSFSKTVDLSYWIYHIGKQSERKALGTVNHSIPTHEAFLFTMMIYHNFIILVVQKSVPAVPPFSGRFIILQNIMIDHIRGTAL